MVSERHTESLWGRERERVSQRDGHVKLDRLFPALKMEEGTTRQRVQAASGSWKKQRKRFSLTALKGTQCC